MPKIDKIEYQKRLFSIQGWIIEGVPSGLIVRQIINAGWTKAVKEKDQKRTAERLLKEARNNWIELEETAIDKKRKIRIARLERIGNKLDERYKSTPSGVMAQIAVEKLIIEVEGTKASTKLELTGKNGNPIEVAGITLTPNELKEYSNQLNNEI